MFELLDETSEVTLSSAPGHAPKTKKGRRAPTNSVTGKRRAEEVKDWVPPVPAGVTLDQGREVLLWDQITAARLYDDWREFDLLIVADIIKMQTEIDRLTSVLRVEGYTRVGHGGVELPHPALKARHMLQQTQLQKSRLISLGAVGSALAANARGAKEGPKSKHSKSNVASLLAA